MKIINNNYQIKIKNNRLLILKFKLKSNKIIKLNI